MNDLSRFTPWVVVAGATLYLLYAVVPPADPADRMHIREFGQIPVVDRGRVKPLDTYARTTLMILNDKQTFKDAKDDTYPAIQWLLDVATTHPNDQIFRIEDANLAKTLNLPQVFRASNPLWIRNQAATRRLLEAEFLKIREKKTELTPYEEAVLSFSRQVVIEDQTEITDNTGMADNLKVFRIENEEVLALLRLKARDGLRYSWAEIDPRRIELEERALVARQKEEKDRLVADKEVLALYQHTQLYIAAARLQELLIVPPPEGEEEWQPLHKGILLTVGAGLKDAPALKLREIFRAYRDKDIDGFNAAVADYRAYTAERFPHDSSDASLEAWFNAFAPFYQCTILYVGVFLLVCISWLDWTAPLNRAAFALALLTLGVHSVALIVRMYLQGRPPVTNLYSSAVFIGWGCLVLCLVLEWLYWNGIGNLAASVLGFLTMLVAHHLAESGDTLEMMQAVLDTNFWLATHVTCITLGYTTTFVAGFLGIVYIVRGVITPSLRGEVAKSLGQMMYGVICFATLLSFVGTVLGGIWADQSWGRFWGWDPKENGALLIVIWNALILHARWGGMVRTRGMALLAIGGNMVTAWSWFGTNQLQVGLHSYGFSNTLATGLMVFWVSQVAFLGLGLIPTESWRSFAAMQTVTLAPAGMPTAPTDPPPAPQAPREKRSRKVKQRR